MWWAVFLPISPPLLCFSLELADYRLKLCKLWAQINLSSLNCSCQVLWISNEHTSMEALCDSAASLASSCKCRPCLITFCLKWVDLSLKDQEFISGSLVSRPWYNWAYHLDLPRDDLCKRKTRLDLLSLQCIHPKSSGRLQYLASVNAWDSQLINHMYPPLLVVTT